MSKYWKTIVACIVIVSCIGTYYVSAFIEDRSYPEFRIHTLEGDESLIEPVVLSGTYIAGDVHQYFQLTHDDFIYRHQQSLFDEMKGVPFSYERKLKEQYSGLLRSHYYSGTSFVENEAYVAQAGFDIDDEWVNGHWQWDATLQVKVANKETGKITKMEYAFNGAGDGPPRVQDIQLNDDEVSVFTISWKPESEVVHEVVEVFVFDLKAKEYKEKISIFSEAAEKVSIRKLHQTPHWKENDYVIYRLGMNDAHEQVTDDFDFEGDHEETGLQEVEDDTKTEHVEPVNTIGSNKLFAYHVKSHELSEIDLPEQLQHREVSLFDGSNLYFVHSEVNSDTVTVFNVESGTIDTEFVIDALTNPNISAYEGMVYALEMKSSFKNDSSKLHVYDATSGERVYYGEIVADESSDMDESHSVELYNLAFR